MINFPSSPVNGQVFTAGDFSWVWDSTPGVWVLQAQTVTGPTGPTGATGPTGPGLTNSFVDGSSPYNVGVGLGAMNGTSPSGTNNVAMGHDAGRSITTGASNVAIGLEALYSATTSTDAVAIGNLAGRATTGGGITAVGYWAFKSNTTGGDTAVGYASLWNNTTGTNNVGVGGYALRSNTTGNRNVAIGYYALNVSNGDNNTSVGALSSYNITTGYRNTAFGADAGRGLTTGFGNTSIGYYAGRGLGTGNNNTSLGYYAQPSTTSVSNQFTLGNGSVTNLRCNDTTISSLSDIRDKANIEDIPVGLDYIKALRPVMFDWNRRPTINQDGEEIINEVYIGRKDFGFIAQELDEVQETFGYAEHTRLVHKDNPDAWEADPMKTYPILVKAVQELAAQVAELQSRLGE